MRSEEARAPVSGEKHAVRSPAREHGGEADERADEQAREHEADRGGRRGKATGARRAGQGHAHGGAHGGGGGGIGRKGGGEHHRAGDPAEQEVFRAGEARDRDAPGEPECGDHKQRQGAIHVDGQVEPERKRRQRDRQGEGGERDRPGRIGGGGVGWRCHGRAQESGPERRWIGERWIKACGIRLSRIALAAFARGVEVGAIMDVRWITFTSPPERRGVLIPIEASRDVPFEIKRVYAVVRPDPGLARGAHAHRALTQVMVALAGRCDVRLDDGETQVVVALDDPARGLLLEPMVWHEMTGFSTDCVLLVLAADHYDEADYIRDRQEFLKAARSSK